MFLLTRFLSGQLAGHQKQHKVPLLSKKPGSNKNKSSLDECTLIKGNSLPSAAVIRRKEGGIKEKPCPHNCHVN